jgi:hypothetical protein
MISTVRLKANFAEKAGPSSCGIYLVGAKPCNVLLPNLIIANDETVLER